MTSRGHRRDGRRRSQGGRLDGQGRMSAELKYVVRVGIAGLSSHAHPRQLACAAVSLPVWIPADARQAAQIMAVLFPSKELLGFPEQDCKVSRKRAQVFPCLAWQEHPACCPRGRV
jgi:hypothetical protein